MVNEKEHGGEGGGHHDDDRGPRVEVLYVNSLKEVAFHAEWNDTFAEVWERAYRELKEKRKEGDKFQCRDGSVDLTPHLQLTLRQARERGICAKRHFQIAGPTGGA